MSTVRARAPRGGARARSLLLAGLSLGALLGASEARLEEASPGRRVLLLYSSNRDFSPYNEISSSFREEVARASGRQVEFVEHSLEAVALGTVGPAPSLAYLQAVEEESRPDVVVTLGGPAADFWKEHRDLVAPGRPTVFGAVEERNVAGWTLGRQDAAVTFRLDLAALLGDFLALRPETTDVLAVFGSSPLERFWAQQLARDWARFRERLRVTVVTELSLDQVAERAAALPPRGAVFFGLMLRDAAGVPHEQREALERIRARSAGPVFGWPDTFLGHGVVGGRLVPVGVLGREVAHVAKRALLGEELGGGRQDLTRLFAAEPRVFDGRELRRWGLDDRPLPTGSVVRFRVPSFFEAYRWRILLALAVIVAQGIGLAALLEGRRRQRRAELESARLRQELAHAGRVSVMGQLASSLAHELAQPLGAILRNAEAAELFLKAEAPDLEEVRAILADIRSDDHRAGDVIGRMRGLLKRRELKAEPLDVGRLVEEVASLVRPDATARGVRVEVDLARDLPSVRGDQVHLQQVLLNLLVNAIEAVEPSAPERRLVAIAARRPDAGGAVEIEVSDTGPGIPADVLPRVFEPFFTTKSSGMGMGLPICRTLVEAHGGTIRAEGRPGGGAVLRVTLPAEGAPA